MEESKTNISIACTVEEKKKLQAAADKDKRPLSNYVLIAALDACQTS